MQFELENGDARRQKVALQELARQYRSNKVLTSENQNSLERIVCGLVLQGGQDQKVVRWCLNCLAQFGRRDVSSEYVHLAINIINHQPEILHFSGHGNQSALCFADKDGKDVIVAGQAFLDLIQLHSNTIECVILNSCQSLDICKLMTGKGIFLIGCDGSIGDNAALAFSGGFYEAIADGRNYEEAFNAGKAQVNLQIGQHADKYSLTV